MRRRIANVLIVTAFFVIPLRFGLSPDEFKFWAIYFVECFWLLLLNYLAG